MKWPRHKHHRSFMAWGTALAVHLAVLSTLAFIWPEPRQLPAELLTELTEVSLPVLAAAHEVDGELGAVVDRVVDRVAHARAGGGKNRSSVPVVMPAAAPTSAVAFAGALPASAAPAGESQPQGATKMVAGDGLGTGTSTGLGGALGAGSGAGVGTGVGSGSGAGVGGGGDAADRLSVIALIKQRIASRRHYPELARRRGIEGKVGVSFFVEPDGRVRRVAVRSSADPALDEAATEAVRAAAPLPWVAGELMVELEYHLEETY